MGLPRWSVLTAIAGGFGLGIGAISLLLKKELDKSANQAIFVKKAIDVMRGEPQVDELLGSSFEVGSAKLLSGLSKMNTEVQVKVPIKGENDNAELYAYGRRRNTGDKFKLYKIEATFNKIKGKKLILMDRSNEDDNDDGQDPSTAREEEQKAEEKVEEQKVEKKPLIDKNEISKKIVVDPKVSWKEQMKSWK